MTAANHIRNEVSRLPRPRTARDLRWNMGGFCRSHTRTFKTNIQMLHTHREWNEYRQRSKRKVKKLGGAVGVPAPVVAVARCGRRHHTHMQESQPKGRGQQILNTEGRGRADWHLPWCKGIPERARSGGHTAAQGHRKTGQITTQIPTSLSATPPRLCNRSGRLLSTLVTCVVTFALRIQFCDASAWKRSPFALEQHHHSQRILQWIWKTFAVGCTKITWTYKTHAG